LKIKKISKKVRKISKQISKHAGTKYGIIKPIGPAGHKTCIQVSCTQYQLSSSTALIELVARMIPLFESTDSLLALFLLEHDTQRPHRFQYIRAQRHTFVCPARWEPWNNARIPLTRFVELFRMSQEDFHWLSNLLRGTLQQDTLRRGDPLSVEAQVAVGLYRLAHGSSYVTIAHVFSIGKETANKASSRFVLAVLEVLRLRVVKLSDSTLIPLILNIANWYDCHKCSLYTVTLC
jgi:hypothetical protein